MYTLPNWAWWIIAAGLLLSPVFAFLSAVLAEILIGAVKDGGVPALIIVIATGFVGWLLLRRPRLRALARTMSGDQA